ncbi:HAD family hydrolase [Polynucleobacter sp. AP-Ainpum-60-G11]|uniref:HAD-IIIC family phosphatase n=1 Tax=Polynucleobacter sp. AP-Ainpum-60-G11 TaxID=2576926 RepID=UPI001BFE0411|nr:HAD-IIIC family phosphatase [Polynucleobacter sp. AP-Ainpum-60-G11]QWE27005.1 HAD-IIIC family phosphatase [Polynucleobacter sp. AP-Ainpum-60-G11]
MNINISSTSFLMPGSPSWNILAKNYGLEFGEFGDWAKSLHLSNSNFLVVIYFLDDLVNMDKVDEKYLDSILDLTENALKSRISSKRGNTIFAYSTRSKLNPICSAINRDIFSKFSANLEIALYKLSSESSGLYLLNLDNIFSSIGFESSFDLRNYYAARCQLSSSGMRVCINAIAEVCNRICTPSKKVLALDCDGTIWGGVVGEVGVGGLDIGGDGVGKVFSDFQAAAKFLSNAGIILVLISKNNEAEVWEVFDKSKEMILKKSDIVASSISWQEKSVGLSHIAEELGLGVDSFVFWDDNPIEREKMRINLPTVYTPELPVDVTKWTNLLLSDPCFSKFSTTEEDQKKISQYKMRTEFINNLKVVNDEYSFLSSIQMRPKAHKITDGSISRAEQLCLKTNQFNLTSIRYSRIELQKIAHSDNHGHFLMELSDNYGDHGIIGLVIYKIDSENLSACIDTFLMSCRVLGRHLEAWVIHKIISELKNLKIKSLYGVYRKTERNILVSTLYENLNFEKVNIHSKEHSGLKFEADQVYKIAIDKYSSEYIGLFNE